MFEKQGDKRLEGASRFYLGEILVECGDLETGETRDPPRARARAAAVAAGDATPASRACCSAAAQTADALACARKGFELMEQLGALEEGESSIRLMYATCLHAAGDASAPVEARRAARSACRRVRAKITDASWRASFLENLPENAATIAFAARLGV